MTFIEQLAMVASMCADPRDSDLVASQLAGWAASNGVTVLPTEPTGQDVEAMERAMASAEFGYSLHLTRLVDGVSTYTLTYSDGSDVLEFESMDEGYDHIANKKKGTQARAAFTALVARYSGGHG